jgi:hypothetical protein
MAMENLRKDRADPKIIGDQEYRHAVEVVIHPTATGT